MYSISDQQIDFILNDLTARGVKTESVLHNLLDHICIIIENNLVDASDFEEFYLSAIKKFYTLELKEIEQETHLLINYRNHLVYSRSQFFLLLFIIFIGPFIGYNIIGLAASWQTAPWSIPFSIWGATIAYSVFPLLILLVLFLTPEKFDPLIPRKSRVLLGINPFIKIIPSQIDRGIEF